MEAFSERLRRLRIKKGLSQIEVATSIGVSPSTYRDWEYGKQIKGEPYILLAAALEVSLTALFSGKTSPGDDLLKEIREMERVMQRIVESMRKTAASL